MSANANLPVPSAPLPVAGFKDIYDIGSVEKALQELPQSASEALRALYEKMLRLGGQRFAVKPSALPAMEELFDELTDVRLVGCTAKYLEMNNLRLARGRFITDKDLAQRENVCVIGDQTARTLFPYQDPVGEFLQVEDAFYVIIGQTRSRTPTAGIGGSMAAQDYNFDVYIPLSTLVDRIGDLVVTSRAGSREGEQVELSQVTVTVRDLEHLARQVEALGERVGRGDVHA